MTILRTPFPVLIISLSACSSKVVGGGTASGGGGATNGTTSSSAGPVTGSDGATSTDSATVASSSAGPGSTTGSAVTTGAGAVTTGAASSTDGGNTTTSGGGASTTISTVSSTTSGPTGPCTTPEVRVTDVSLPSSVIGNGQQGDTELLPMAIAAKPSGGSTLAWLTAESQIYIADLDGSDQIMGAPFSIPGIDLGDIAAEDTGGVVALTRDAEGGGTLNCGTPANLCDGGPNPAIPCYDMYLVRFDNGSESWATKLTTSSASLPPYSTGPSGPTVNMIWWYQNHARIAFDGTNYATYFCNAISISEGGCINIHEGDRMQVVGPSGDLVDHPNAFAGGCSHSWNTRIVYDDRSDEFVTVCATDNQNRIARSPGYQTIMSTPDIGTASVGNLVLGSGGGYWVTVSHQGTVHLLHFNDAQPDMDLDVAQADFSHLASYGSSNMILAWRSGSGLTAQVLSAADGSAVSDEFSIDVTDHRYQAMKSFPDGSVAFPGQGSGNQSISVARVMPCE